MSIIKKMENPFNYTTELIPGKDKLIGREVEIADLSTALDNNIPSLLLGRRNVGKSSIFKFMLFKARQNGFYVIDVDCAFATSIDMFLKEIIFQLREEDLWEEIQVYIKRLEPAVVEKTTNTGLEKILRHSHSNKKTIPNYEESHAAVDKLINVLRALNMMIADKRQKLLFLFDEVQTWNKISDNEDLSIANLVQTIYKNNDYINYFFSGSQRRLLEGMFLDDQESGFWNSINTLDLEVPPRKEMINFIIDSFSETDKSIEKKAAETIWSIAGLNTEAVQELAFFTWQVAGTETATISTVYSALENILSKHNSTYKRLIGKINTYGKSKDEVYLGLAFKPTAKVASIMWLRDVGLASRVDKVEMKRAIEELSNSGAIIKLKDGHYTPSDPFLPAWLARYARE